jgi:hypothetical protein
MGAASDVSTWLQHPHHTAQAVATTPTRVAVPRKRAHGDGKPMKERTIGV